jgi:sec-independent protein translocase protein TatC
MATKRPELESSEQPGGEMTFVEHLMELRERLIKVLISVLVFVLVLFPFKNWLYEVVSEPLLARLPHGATMIATEVASPFLAPVKLIVVIAVLLSMPVILYHLWGFVAPGLYKHERRLILPLLVTSTVLFYLGMVFAYYVVFPLMFAFFTSAAPSGVEVMTDISRYLDFVLKVFFAFGVAFEIPVATCLLVWAGITTPEAMTSKRPYIIVAVFVIGMLLTPPDIISQTLLALPMWGLFELGVIFSRFYVGRSLSSPDAEEDSGS